MDLSPDVALSLSTFIIVTIYTGFPPINLYMCQHCCHAQRRSAATFSVYILIPETFQFFKLKKIEIVFEMVDAFSFISEGVI